MNRVLEQWSVPRTGVMSEYHIPEASHEMLPLLAILAAQSGDAGATDDRAARRDVKVRARRSRSWCDASSVTLVRDGLSLVGGMGS